MASATRRRCTERQPLVGRVKALAEALEGSDVSHLELTEGGTKISIRRGNAEQETLPAPTVGKSSAPSRPAGSRVTRPAGLGRPAAKAPSAPDPTVAVLAPLTGVYYSSPSPSSGPFVEIGGTVQAGQVVCIIEAMKVFNELKAEVSGTVTTVLAKNGQLVQKNDALMRVKPI